MKIFNNTFSRHLHAFSIYFSSFYCCFCCILLLLFVTSTCKPVQIVYYIYTWTSCSLWVNKEMNWSMLSLIFWRLVYGVWCMVYGCHCFKPISLIKTGMFCINFGKNWPSGNVKEYFLKLSIFSFDFTIIFHWGRTWPLIWTDLL